MFHRILNPVLQPCSPTLFTATEPIEMVDDNYRAYPPISLVISLWYKQAEALVR